MSAVQPFAAAIAGVATAEGRLFRMTAADSFLCFPIKPLQFKSCRISHSLHRLSCSRKAAPLRPAFVAKTSDWAQQQEQEGDDDDEEEKDIEEEEGEGGWAVAEEVEEGIEVEVGSGVEVNGEAESYSEPPEGAKLFVGNLPYDVDSESLAHLFEQAGIVEIAEVIYNRDTDKSRGFGFITMSTVEEAEKAVEMFHHYDYNGRLLNVNKAAPRGARLEGPRREYAPSFRLYVGNLPWQMDDARLEQVFSNYGKVINARVVTDRESGRSRGFGFVIMSSQAEMENAISSLDGQSLDGRQIRVSVAEEKPRRF